MEKVAVQHFVQSLSAAIRLVTVAAVYIIGASQVLSPPLADAVLQVEVPLAQEGERVLQNDVAVRIRRAVNEKEELVGAIFVWESRQDSLLQIQKRGGTVRICTVRRPESLSAIGFATSTRFLAWSGLIQFFRFDVIGKSPDELYSMFLTGQCHILLDYADNLDRYVRALKREPTKRFELGPVMTRPEAQEFFAAAKGYKAWSDFSLSQRLGKDGASPTQLDRLRSYGVTTEAVFARIVTRMNADRYNSDPNPMAEELLEFLQDEAEGEKTGRSARQYRKDEHARSLAQEKAAEERLAKEYPLIAVLSCGVPKHIGNVAACFSGGLRDVDTELILSQGNSRVHYKAYDLRGTGGSERRDGFYLNLKRRSTVVAENVHDTLMLGLKVIERQSGKLLYQGEAGKYGVVRFSDR